MYVQAGPLNGVRASTVKRKGQILKRLRFRRSSSWWAADVPSSCGVRCKYWCAWIVLQWSSTHASLTSMSPSYAGVKLKSGLYTGGFSGESEAVFQVCKVI